MSGGDVMLAAALDYARRGWTVLPLHTPVNGGCSCKRDDCNAVGKHPRTKNGLLGATNDQGRIRTWWSQWPDANIGILTGSESGLLVVDVDNKGGTKGSKNLATLSADFGGLPITLTATTGSGEHLFFKHPGVEVKNSTSKIADGVDVRAERGYVVAAPSLHANGKRYGWLGLKQQLAEVPVWLLARITTNKEKRKRMQDEKHNPFMEAPTIDKGERNDTLYRLGCALRGLQGMEQEQIEAILLEYNTAKCDPPLDEEEVLQIAESACQHPPEVKVSKSAKRQEENPLYWFKFNLRDWFANQDINMMTDYQTGWYIRLLAFAWQKGGFLPADRKKLYKLAKAKSLNAFEKDCELVLAEFEEVDINGQKALKNPRITTIYANTLSDWLKKKKAGEASKAVRLAGLQNKQQLTRATPSPLPTVH